MTVPATADQARTAKAAAKALLADVHEVVGIGITRLDGAGYALKVNLRAPVGAGTIPDAIEGVAVQVEVVGKIEKHGKH